MVPVDSCEGCEECEECEGCEECEECEEYEEWSVWVVNYFDLVAKHVLPISGSSEIPSEG